VDVKFRPFTHNDSTELKEMIFCLYREDPDGGKVTEENISSTIRELTANPHNGSITIFEIEGEIAGYAILIFFWSNEYGGDILHIDEIYVKPSWRNKGIASDFIKGYADKVKAIWLEVIPTNEKAMKFYKKLGFKETKNTWLIKSGEKNC